MLYKQTLLWESSIMFASVVFLRISWVSLEMERGWNKVRQQFADFLHHHELFPINDSTWKSIELRHSAPVSDHEIASTRTEIRQAIGNVNGLYVYMNQSGQVLYVGKGKPVWNRVYSHYLESFKQVPGDKSGKWFRFFSSNQGTVKVFWIEVEGEAERRICEAMLSLFVSPQFDTF